MQYFQSKKMTKMQIAVFITEHYWDYWCGCLLELCHTCLLIFLSWPVFGFIAALLETLPFVGMVFSISNQVGAAMWAHGL